MAGKGGLPTFACDEDPTFSLVEEVNLSPEDIRAPRSSDHRSGRAQRVFQLRRQTQREGTSMKNFAGKIAVVTGGGKEDATAPKMR